MKVMQLDVLGLYKDNQNDEANATLFCVTKKLICIRSQIHFKLLMYKSDQFISTAIFSFPARPTN